MRCGRWRAGLAAVLLGLVACVHAPPIAVPADPVARAALWLEGEFDNRAQAAADPGFLAVQVRWRRLWTARTDGPWFLVEQTLAGDARPYRQRVHRLRGDGSGGVVSEVYLPRDPQAWAGADAHALLATLAPADLAPLPGCAVHLRPAPGGFTGGTRGRDCPSRLRDARWTSAEVRIDAAGFDSWDRGFDADGRQVWGAVAGPYRFRRRAD